MSVIHSRPIDLSTYRTIAHPEEYDVDWAGFYRRADAATELLRRSVGHELGVMYGDHPYQILDIYRPSGSSNGVALVFFHGGAFREGHPGHYGYLARPFVARGSFYVSAGYRLLPEVEVANCLEDAQQAIGWLYLNRERWGLHRVVVSGHSAGARIVAALALTRGWRSRYGVPDEFVAGGIAISGGYGMFHEVAAHRHGSVSRPGDEPFTNIECTPPLIVAYGPAERNRAGEPAGAYADSSEALIDVLRSRGAPVTDVPLPGLDHPDTADALAAKGSPLHAAALELMKEGSS